MRRLAPSRSSGDRLENDIVETARAHLRLDPLALGAAANQQENDVPFMTQPRGRGQNGGEIVGTPHIAGVSHDEAPGKIPLPAQIVGGCGRVHLRLRARPVVDHLDRGRIDTLGDDPARHCLTDGDVAPGMTERTVAQAAQQRRHHPHRPHAELDRHLRKQILNQLTNLAPRRHTTAAARTEISGGSVFATTVSPARTIYQCRCRGDVETEVIESPPQQTPAAEARRPDPTDLDTVDGFTRRQTYLGIVIGLRTGNDDDLHPVRGEMESEIAQQLTGGRMIGIKEAIDEDDAAILHWADATSARSRTRRAGLPR